MRSEKGSQNPEEGFLSGGSPLGKEIEKALRRYNKLEGIKRIKKDFPYLKEEALNIMKKGVKNFKEDEFKMWEKEGYIDKLIVDNREYFFSRFLDNLFFLNKELEKRRLRKNERAENARKMLNERILNIRKGKKGVYRITAGITITLQEKDSYRVWLPVPTENMQIKNIKILKTDPVSYTISLKSKQRTVHFEAEQKTFGVEFQYDISEVLYDIDPNKVEGVESLDEYLSEKMPHISFTPYLRNLTNRIVGEEKNPYLKAKDIYHWITDNVRYTYVPEYSLFDNISEYVARNLRGDCGMHALLFITMCRIAGVPAKWQSGWYVTPNYASPHDWAQVYIKPYGWIPVDASFGNVRKNNELKRDFYFGALDAFRMISNEDFQVQFDPPKRYMRSDPIDNQRGEVENKKENIYYDKFKWEISVKRFNRIA